jgi:hypothetical protein
VKETESLKTLATKWTGIPFPAEEKIIAFATAVSRPVLDPVFVDTRVKRSEREADHSSNNTGISFISPTQCLHVFRSVLTTNSCCFLEM